MRRILSILAVLAVATAMTAGTATAAVPSKKCASAHHSSDMDMSTSTKCTKSAMDKNRPVADGAREITVSADDLAFTPNRIDITAGENVAIVLSADDVPHDFYVKGVGHVVHVKADKTARGGLRITKPGTYKFWCTVAGHKQAGMTGTITVTA